MNLICRAALVLIVVLPLNARGDDPRVILALERLAAHDPGAAIKQMEEVTAHEPKHGRSWRVLGTAYQQAKEFDKAIEAYGKSLELEPQNQSPLYNIAAAYALKGDRERAFEWLTKARATHRVDMTGLAQDEDLASLRRDSRFASLLPKPDDFKNPFVEDVKVIREWDGEAANDQFGWIARSMGDVDGDGVPDFVTSAPTSGDHAGRVYVYSTKSGKLLWKADGKAKDELGTGVECAGDTNGDGVADVVASGPGGHVAYIYSGKDGRVLVTLKSEVKDEDFGRHVSGVGDIDRDGFADVIVGAPPPENTPEGKGIGHAYVYSGKNGANLLTLVGETEGDGFGSAVAGFSDKKQTFLVVGAPHAGPEKKGRVFVYGGLSAKPKFVIEGDATAKQLGAMFVSVVGDIDADGIPDIYASDWSNEAKGRSTGRIYVHSGKDGRRLLTLTGETAGEGFGTCPAPAGDVDGDGRDDLIIGAWQYAGAAASAGRAALYSGKDGRLMKTYTCRIPGDTFGFDAVGMGDVDKDGTIDFLITSGWSGVNGFHSGRVFLISSGLKRKQ
jgi:FG-GAP repeat/Tetratricopeptide repeat/FG-GAP-like repeat